MWTRNRADGPPPLTTALHAVEYMNAETVDYLGATPTTRWVTWGQTLPSIAVPLVVWHLTHFDIGASRLHDPNRSDSALPVRGGSEPLVWPHRLQVRRYGSEGGGSAPQLLPKRRSPNSI